MATVEDSKRETDSDPLMETVNTSFDISLDETNALQAETVGSFFAHGCTL
jgi:hypothetical protein